MRRSLHHLRKECQHYEVSIQVPSPTSPPGLYPPLPFSNGKALGTKLVVTCDAPIHEDLGVIYVVFHALYTTSLLLVSLLTYHRFLKIHHFTAVGLVS